MVGYPNAFNERSFMLGSFAANLVSTHNRVLSAGWLCVDMSMV